MMQHSSSCGTISEITRSGQAPPAFLRGLFYALLATLLLCVPLDAQVVRGQVLAAEDGRPLSGVFIVLIDSQGQQRAASLSDIDGRFRIQAPSPGSYTVRGEVVGRPTDLSDPFTLASGEEKTLRLVSFTRPQTLTPVHVMSATSCKASPDDEKVASLWLEVTKALRISEWSVRDDRLVFDIETTRREWDDKYRRSGPPERRIWEDIGGRPFTTMDPEFLAENGYVVVRDYDNLYFAPDAKSLLHESFVSQHCLSLAPPRPGFESLIGIAFSRAPDRDRPDISGVFWLHRDSLLLRSVEYRYSGLPEFDLHEAIGGSMEFARLPTGEWYVSRWSIRMPSITLCNATGLFGVFLGRLEPCLDGIIEASGEVVDVRRRVRVDPERRLRSPQGSG